jgi:hypothetical protein
MLRAEMVPIWADFGADCPGFPLRQGGPQCFSGAPAPEHRISQCFGWKNGLFCAIQGSGNSRQVALRPAFSADFLIPNFSESKC